MLGRFWSFINGTVEIKYARSGEKGANIRYIGRGEDRVRVRGPDTLVLLNVDQTYNGIYQLAITTSGPDYKSAVTVFIAGKFNSMNKIFFQNCCDNNFKFCGVARIRDWHGED